VAQAQQPLAEPMPARAGKRIPNAGPFEWLVRALRMRNETLALTERMYERYGPIVATNIGFMKSVNLFGPDANKFVMLDRDGNLSAKGAWDLIMGRIFSNGLLLMDGDEHRFHRRIMQQAFSIPALESYVELMGPRVAESTGDWHLRGPGFRAYPAFKTLTLNLAAAVFLGAELGPVTRHLNRAFEDTVAASMSIVRLPIPGLEFQRGLAGRKWMIEFFRSLLPEKRTSSGSDMLSRLCRARSEDGRFFSDGEIIDHMIFLMMAAHDTTTSTLTSMLYELGRRPEWQERLREESRAVRSPLLGFSEMDRVPALGWVMQETLRRYPPLSTVPRLSVREFDYQGYRVPARALIVVFPIHTHHMKEWWSDPYAFDPERFSDARAEHRRHSHSWVPFGGGAHTCIGLRFAELQIKTILHQLLLRYRWSVPEGYQMPVQQAPISKPRDGLPVRFERID
jgi:cytochrome P450